MNSTEELTQRELDSIKEGFPLLASVDSASTIRPLSDVLDDASRLTMDTPSSMLHAVVKILSTKLEAMLLTDLMVRIDHKDAFPSTEVLGLARYLKDHSIIQSLELYPHITDYPKIPLYISKSDPRKIATDGGWAHGGGIGTGFNKNRAALASLYEAAERYSCATYNSDDFIEASHRTLGASAIDPRDVVSFSATQLENAGNEAFENFRSRLIYDEDTIFRWARGYSLNTGRNTWIPAQLAYFTYKHKHDYEEQIIRLPISTGQAGGSSLESAIYAGLCESIERDALMIFWLNRLTLPQIDIKEVEDTEVQTLYRAYVTYGVTPYVLDMTTDIGVPSICCILIDGNQEGVAVAMGAKADLNPVIAIRGALEEAFSALYLARTLKVERRNYLDELITHPKLLLASPYDPRRVIEDRILLWAHHNMLPKIEFALTGKRKRLRERKAPVEAREKMDVVIHALERCGIESYFVETTLPVLRKVGFYAVSTIVPKLQPLYLDEHFRYLGGERLHNVPKKMGYQTSGEFNSDPHPFG